MRGYHLQAALELVCFLSSRSCSLKNLQPTVTHISSPPALACMCCRGEQACAMQRPPAGPRSAWLRLSLRGAREGRGDVRRGGRQRTSKI